jgi:hypothetical protein
MQGSAQGQKLSGIGKDEVVIELGGARNENVHYGPLRKTLRGAWNRYHLPPGTTAIEGSGVLNIESVPGMYLCLDVAGRTLRVVDPLALRDFAHLLPLINQNVSGGAKDWKPVPSERYEKLSDDQLATQVYWFRRLVETGLARIAQLNGDWPSVAGRERVDWFNTNPQAKKYADEFAGDAQEETDLLTPAK